MKKICIINDCGFFNERFPEMITDGAVELSVDLPPVCGEFYLVGKNNGAQTEKIKIVSGQKIVIKGLEAGVFTSVIKYYLRGELIEIYPVETLVLKDVNGKVYGIPDIEHLKVQLLSAEKRIETLEQANSTMADMLKTMHMRLLNLEKINKED